MKLKIDDSIIMDLKIAKNMFSRMKGLMGKKEIDYAMYFYPCNAIHTFFMKIPIDVLYLDNCGNILSMDINLKPWKIGKYHRKAKCVIELPSNSIQKYNIQIGQMVSFYRE